MANVLETHVTESECRERHREVFRTIWGNWKWAIGIVMVIGLASIGAWMILIQRVTAVETKVEAQQTMLREIGDGVKEIKRHNEFRGE